MSVREHGPTYGDRANVRPMQVAGALDVSVPVAGFYKMRLRSGAIKSGVHILHGPPLDPVTGDQLDRSWRWQAFVNGEYFDDFDRLWPACAREPIDAAEYRRLCSRLRWAEQNAPSSAYADRSQKYDPLSSQEALPF